MTRNISSVKKVLLNSGIYSITSILQKALGFFLIPLYTAYLSPSDYGIIGLVVAFTSVLSLFFTLALNGAISRFYYDYKDDEESLKNYWGTIIVFVVLNSALLSIIFIVFNGFLVAPFVKGVVFYPYVLLGILSVLVSPVYSMYQSILQIKQEAITYSVNSILNFIIALVLNILFIVIFDLKATGLMLSTFITGFFFALVAVIHMLKRKLINITLNKKYLKESLSYSVPLLPHLMSSVIANFSSRFFLNNNSSIYNLGLYNVGSQFGNIFDIVQYSVNSAYTPWFFDLMSKGKKEHKKIIEFADLLLRANCILALFLSLYIKEIIQIMTNSSYLLAWTIVPIMMIAYQIRGIYFFYVNALFYNKSATRYIFSATLSGNLISIVLSAIYTSKFGLLTPALVLLVEKIVTTLIIIILSRKFEPINFKLIRMLMYVLLLIISSATGLFFDILKPDGPILLCVVFFKIFVILVTFIILFLKDFNIFKKMILNIRQWINGEN